MGRQKTNKEFIQEIKSLHGDDYTLLSEYKHSQEHVLMRHNVCQYEWLVTPNSFLRISSCPNCAKVNITKTDKEFRDEIKELVGSEYEILGDYENSYTPILIRHNRCNKTFSPVPNMFLQGTRCPYCNELRKAERLKPFAAKSLHDN